MRILLADPNALVRSGLCALIQQRSHVEVVGEAGDEAQLTTLLRDVQADALVMDRLIDPAGGLGLLGRLHARFPRIAIFLLTSLIDASLLRGAIHMGAAGVISKNGDPDELSRAFAALANAQLYLSPTISALMLDSGRRRQAFDILTPRQQQVLRLIAAGQSTRQIAARLGVSIKTVETHRARMMAALGLNGTHALMRYAIRQGFDTELDAARA